MSELKPIPCPWCGEQPDLLPHDPESEGDAWGAVACVNENCPGQPEVNDGEISSDERGTAAYQQCAIKRWNTRAPDRELIRYALIQSDWGRNPYTPFADLDAAVETIASGWEGKNE